MEAEIVSDGCYSCRSIELSDRGALDDIRLREGHTLSAHAFVSLYLWQEDLGLSLCCMQDAFFVRIAQRGENAWLFPCGGAQAKLDFLYKMGKAPGFSLHYLRREDVDFLKRNLPGRFRFIEMRGDAEYLYRRAAQLEMRGKPYKRMRIRISRALKHHIWQVAELNETSFEEAAEVIRIWQEHHGAPGDQHVSLLALREYEALGMQGILLRNEEGAQAVAMGSIIAPGVFDLHVTKTLQSGLDTLLKQELYRRLPETVEWIDQEEDLDIPGLRINKLEAQPDKLVTLWKGVTTE